MTLARIIILMAVVLAPVNALAAGMDIMSVKANPDGSSTYTLTLQIMIFMTMLTVLPALLLSMTSFVRITIVLSLLRQAMGTMSTPSNQIIIGLSLFLTFFIMSPFLDKAYNEGVKPYLDEQIPAETALVKVQEPFRKFMLDQVRENDLVLFAELAAKPDVVKDKDKIPMSVLMPAFLTSELKTAFQIGFLIFIPFLIIDLVVASVLMAMGMMMLSPMVVSLPFKIMLFVLVDGWVLVIGTLANSFYVR